ncbi:MAG: hypothetical protein JWM57_3214, partial [Phycisphaerales bacterium]|nr:hypothetical protein [Phycisphaerales bacterium]
MARNISTHLAFAATVAVMGLGGISSTQAAVIYTAGSNLYVSGQNHVNLDGLSGNDIRVTSQAANYYNIGSDGSGGQWATDITGGPPTNYTRAPLKFNFGDTVGAAGQLFVGP